MTCLVKTERINFKRNEYFNYTKMVIIFFKITDKMEILKLKINKKKNVYEKTF